jgi:hypothetical protein
MSSEQITQETVPVEQTTTTETATPTTQPTTETKPEVTTTTTTTTSSWKDSISEAYRNDPNIEKVYRDRCVSKILYQCYKDDWSR